MAIHRRELADEERAKIERLRHSRAAPLRLVRQAWIIRLPAAGETVPAIARALNLTAPTVRDWLRRFDADRLAALGDAPGSGRLPKHTEDQRSVPLKPEGDDASSRKVAG